MLSPSCEAGGFFSLWTLNKSMDYYVIFGLTLKQMNVS